MTEIIFVLIISFLVEVESSCDPIGDNYKCSCAHVNSEFESIKKMLQDLNEIASRKVCPSGFDYLPEADACYKLVFQSLTWDRAGELCRNIMPGVHLSAITSAVKQKAIESYLQQEFKKRESSICHTHLLNDGGKQVWLGGQTQDPNQCNTPYVWKTLTEVNIPFDYANWNVDEPNCLRTVENCAQISDNRKYAWNDADCNHLSCALCEV